MFPTQKINKKITPPQTVPSNIIGFWMLKLFGLTFHSATFLKAITDQVICLETLALIHLKCREVTPLKSLRRHMRECERETDKKH